MIVVNSKGRELLKVTSATAEGMDKGGFINTMYSYTGSNCGGYTDLTGLQRTIDAIKIDHPSAKVEGFLPHPTIRNWKEVK